MIKVDPRLLRDCAGGYGEPGSWSGANLTHQLWLRDHVLAGIKKIVGCHEREELVESPADDEQPVVDFLADLVHDQLGLPSPSWPAALPAEPLVAEVVRHFGMRVVRPGFEKNVRVRAGVQTEELVEVAEKQALHDEIAAIQITAAAKAEESKAEIRSLRHTRGAERNAPHASQDGFTPRRASRHRRLEASISTQATS